ncbi:MAG: MerR family transcriptional regulator [Bacteroidales bacterium]|nr:MerR family transcriptional regulator [Bacteroidales bacterium]
MEKDLKLFYSIGEVAEMFQLPESTIRFWENEFEILKPQRNKKGNRMFTKQDLENLKVINYMVKVRGYTLAGAKVKLKEERDLFRKKTEMESILLKLKQNLTIIREQL